MYWTNPQLLRNCFVIFGADSQANNSTVSFTRIYSEKSISVTTVALGVGMRLG